MHLSVKIVKVSGIKIAVNSLSFDHITSLDIRFFQLDCNLIDRRLDIRYRFVLKVEKCSGRNQWTVFHSANMLKETTQGRRSQMVTTSNVRTNDEGVPPLRSMAERS